MAKKSLWKSPDGKLVVQDPQWDADMAARGYTPGNEEDAVRWKELKAAGGPMVPNAGGTAPVEPPDPNDKEGVLAQNIINNTRDTGEMITADEARRRAKAIMSSARDPNAPVLRQGTDEFGDIPSAIGAGLEGAAAGVSFGIVPFLEGKAGDFLEETFPETFLDNPLTSANIERRREANPVISLTTDIGAGLLQGGFGLLKNVAPRVFARLASKGYGVGKGVQLLTELDVPTRIATSASQRAGARAVGAVDAVGAARNEIEALRAAQESSSRLLTAAEKEVLDVFEASAKPRPLEKLAGLPEKLTGRGVKAADIAENRAVRERAAYVIDRKLAESYKSLGWKKKGLYLLENSGIGLTTGVVGGGTRAFADEALRDNALSPQDVGAIGESWVGRALERTGESGAIGALLGGGAPLVLEGIQSGLSLTRDAMSGLTTKLYPSIGGLFTDVDPETIRRGVKFGDALANIDVKEETRKLTNAFQYQYDNALSYVQHLESLRTQMESQARTAFPAEAFRGKQSLYSDLQTAVREFAEEYGNPLGAGRYEISNRKIRQALADAPIRYTTRLLPPTTPGGPREATAVAEVVLPDKMRRMQDILEEVEQSLIVLAGDIEDSASSAGVALGSLPAPASRGYNIGSYFMENAPVPLAREPVYGFDVPSAFAPAGKPRLFPEMENLSLGIIPSEDIRAARAAGRPITEVPALDVFAYQLAGKKIESTIAGDLGSIAKNIAAPTIGLSVAGSLLGLEPLSAVVGSTALTLGSNLLFNPNATLSSYRAIQKLNKMTENGIGRLTSRLVRGAAYEPLSEVGGKLTEGPTAITLTPLSARDTWENDSKRFASLAGDMGYPDVTRLLNSVNYAGLQSQYPQLADDYAISEAKKLNYLYPRWSKLQAKGDKITEAEKYQYALVSNYVNYPETIFDDVAKKNFISDTALDVLKNVHPNLYSKFVTKLSDELGTIAAEGGKVPNAFRPVINKLLGKKYFNASDVINIQKAVQVEGQRSQGNPGRIQTEREGTSNPLGR